MQDSCICCYPRKILHLSPTHCRDFLYPFFKHFFKREEVFKHGEGRYEPWRCKTRCGT
nr:MAG TPA: hypothetical protein [Bacteriophage sp.]